MAPHLFFKRCLRCNTSYNTYEQDKDYCTDSCKCLHTKRLESSKKKCSFNLGKEQVCKWCGNKFTLTRGNLRYCNAACQIEHSIYLRRIRHAALIEKKVCSVCGQEFYGHKLRKYCNYVCANQKMRELNTKKVKKSKPVKKRRLRPYHVLNHMAEKKRLDEEWNLL